MLTNPTPKLLPNTFPSIKVVKFKLNTFGLMVMVDYVEGEGLRFERAETMPAPVAEKAIVA